MQIVPFKNIYGIYFRSPNVEIFYGTVMFEYREVPCGYGAESRRKVVSSRLRFAVRPLENSLCQPSSKWVPFSN